METNVRDSAIPQPRLRERYAHLYMPLITVFLIMTNAPIVAKAADPSNDNPQNIVFATAASALPTYFVASRLYASNRPDATPEEAVRFTRKHDAYRALVIATYGRIFGTPFNATFIIIDFILSYVMGLIIGERPAGTRQRRSELFVALLWLAGSGIVVASVPPSMPTLAFCTNVFDRTVWRAAYLALVDDIVGLLTRPNVRTLRGKATLILVQAFTITSLVYLALARIKKLRTAE